MAKVDTINIKYQGEFRLFEVHFNKTSLFFIKDCPGEIIEYGEFDNRDTQLHTIIDKFKIAVKKAEDVLQNTRKVILVKFSIASKMIGTEISKGTMSIDTSHKLYKFVPDFSDRIEGFGFSIDYRVVQEVTRGAEVAYYHLDTADTTWRRGAITKLNNEIPIPFTDESVSSLEQIKTSLKAMVMQISDFFSDAEKLSIALNSGNFKMLN